MRRRLLPLLIVPALALTACSGTSTTTATDDPAPSAAQSVTPGASVAPSGSTKEKGSSEPSAAPAGRLVSYDDWQADPASYADSDVVLYFHASWCHNCQDTDASIEADGVPAGLTLVKIDYDERTDLRQEYGVTVQHTFVLVDEGGTRQDIWTGTTTGADIAARAA